MSDKKIAVDSDNDGVINYYTADVVTASDYYVYGMTMPGRKFTQANSSYRYGFNGKEKSDEIYGESNAYDYGNRIYDPRLGRWFKPDVLEARLPMLSSYHFGLNNPLRYSDHQGDYVIDEATAKAYPKLKPVLAALLAEFQKPENSKKVDELVRLGQFKDRQAFYDVLTDNKGPKLSVQNLVNIDKRITKSYKDVQAQNALGGISTQSQETVTTDYAISLTAVGIALGVNPGEHPAAITKTVTNTLQEGETVITRSAPNGGKIKITNPGIFTESTTQEVVLDDNLANILNNNEIKMNKDGTIKMGKLNDAVTYFLKVITHETGHVGDQAAKVPGAAAPKGTEIGKASEDSYFNSKKQISISGTEVLEANKPKEK
ncbi:RHS repeat domain-containing protein [Mucilaginibacter sp.]|uniref:RHS repeat domain-containing protein n=1 Tax=Mucilaginibacter sp. TaxID=1882438 RepID=UPI00374D98B3